MIAAGNNLDPNFGVSMPGVKNESGLAVGPNGPNVAEAGGMSTMEGLVGANLVLGAGTAVNGIISSIAGYCMAKDQMSFQRKSINSQLQFQDDKARIQMEMEKDKTYWQERTIAGQVEYQKEYHEAREEHAEAEGRLEVAKTRLEEMEKTKKAGEINTKKLNRLLRSKYSYGSPLSA